MAQKYIVQLVDDLTQEPIEEGAGESVRFSLDGVGYTIDLTNEHADELRNLLSPYVSKARKGDGVGRAAGRSATASARAPKGDLKAIREWASSNGYKVSSRGRIPAEVQNAYNAAH
jgi:GNAT superfamily N-acetyltransferase